MVMNNNKIDTKISTTMLLSRMKECSSIEGYIEENEKEFLNCSFAEYITQICREKSLIPERVIKESYITEVILKMTNQVNTYLLTQ